MYPTITLFGHDLATYTINLVFSILGAVIIYMFYAKTFKFTAKERLVIILPTAVSFVIASKLLFFAEAGRFHWGGSGFSLFGTIFVFPIIMIPISLLIKKNYFHVSASVIPILALALGQAKIGCFLAGCCYGLRASWGLPDLFNPEVLRLPVQLFEAGSCFLIALICFLINHRRKYAEFTAPLFYLLYGLCRFALEYMRDNLKPFFSMSQAQIYCLTIILLSLCMIIFMNKQQIRSSSKKATVKGEI